MSLTDNEQLELNKLSYEFPVNPSVVNKRTYKEYNFSNASYAPSSTGQCLVNSGADAVWGATSYIKIGVTITGTAADVVYLGGRAAGSVFNLVQNVRLTHRSGVVLEDIRNVDKLACMRRRWGQTNDQFSNTFESEGGFDNSTGITIPGGGSTTIQYVMPLKHLLGIFSLEDSYLPPGFLAGARLEIDWNSNARALKVNSTDATTYSVSSISLVLDSAEIYDSARKSLLEEQMNVDRSGLQLTYPTWFGTDFTTSGTGAINFNINKSASLASQAIVCSQLTAKNTSTQNDSIMFNTEELLGWQFRLGSLYLPTQVPITSVPEGYLQSVQAWDAASGQNKHQKVGATSLTYSQYATTNTSYNQSLHAVSMETSSAGLEMTGQPTNNSRQLTYSTTSSVDASTIFVFLKYARVCNIMGDNVVVDE